jgi:hypothetical protein
VPSAQQFGHEGKRYEDIIFFLLVDGHRAPVTTKTIRSNLLGTGH